jgi:hypothetical protein
LKLDLGTESKQERSPERARLYPVRSLKLVLGTKTPKPQNIRRKYNRHQAIPQGFDGDIFYVREKAGFFIELRV